MAKDSEIKKMEPKPLTIETLNSVLKKTEEKVEEKPKEEKPKEEKPKEEKKLPVVDKVEFRRGFLHPEVIKAAQNSQRLNGVPTCITLAQFILESAWGTKNMGVNNFFGIKDLKSDPGFIEVDTTEYIDGKKVVIKAKFEDFDSVEHAFRIHGRLLSTSKYYVKAMEAKNDPDEFARRLTGVYATDPNYGSKLIKIMNVYDLYRYNL